MRQPAPRGLAWQWPAAAALAWAAGGLLVLAAPVPFRRGLTASAFLGGAASGAALGLLQWLVLRRHLRVSLWWPVATVIAVGLFSYAVAPLWPGDLMTASWPIWFPPNYVPSLQDYLVIVPWSAVVGCVFGTVTGALLGVGQWLALRRAGLRAGNWIGANALGLALGGAAGAIVLSWLQMAVGPGSGAVIEALGLAVAGVVRGAVSGAVTARPLLRLL